MKTILYVLLTIFGGLLAAAGTGAWMLFPPGLDVPPRERVVIADVTLINPGLERTDGAHVLIADGVVREIRKAPLNVTQEDAPRTRVIDGRGKFLLPGLIDMHVHLAPRTAIGNPELFQLLFLAHGVTAIRDMGTTDGNVFALRERVNAGEIPGTRIYAVGRLLDGTPKSWPIAREVAGPDDAAIAVREQVEAGADFIKVYTKLDAPSLRAIHTAAREMDRRAIGHIPIAVPFEQSGVSDAQHFEEVIQYDAPDDRTVRIANKQRRYRNLGEAEYRKIVQTSLDQNIAHTPTLLNGRRRLWLQEFERARQSEPALLLPRLWSDVVWKPSDRYAAEGAANEMNAGDDHAHDEEWWYRFACDMTGRLHREGVRIHAGTDILMPFVVPGESLIGEIEELHRCGLSREDALAAATTWAGEFLASAGSHGGVSGEGATCYGSVPPGRVVVGAPADLVLFAKSPLDDLSALRERDVVIAGGRVYEQDVLDGMVERYRAHFRGWWYDGIMTGVAAWLKGGYQ